MIRIHAYSNPFGRSISPSTPAQINPKTSYIKVSQNKIQVIVSVFVNFLVAIDVTANPIAQSAAAIIAGLKVLKSGLATINMPRKPSKIANNLIKVIFSFKKIGANTATQIGTENSNANN